MLDETHEQGACLTISADDLKWGLSDNGDRRPTTVVSGVNADLLLRVLVDTVQRYVVMMREQAITVALWIVHTYVFDAAECTPYLAANSAAKQSGKTRLLELLELLVKRPWLTGRVTAAVLIRKTDKEHPTLLLDESDATFNGDQEYSEALRGLLNTGYRRSGKASLCVGQGAGMGYKDFSTFCPKVIAGIGKLPDTVADRSIPITLKRRAKSEPVCRFRERAVKAETEPIRRQLEAWAKAHVNALRAREPELPDTLGNRAQDVWEPLLAIADLVGGEWPTLARKAATVLSGAVRVEDEDIKIQLLADARPLVVKVAERPEALVPTKELLAHLHGLEDRPWHEWGKLAKPITSATVATLLRGFDLFPISNGQARGYRVDLFLDAFDRYLAADRDFNPPSRQSTNKDRAKSPNSTRQEKTSTDGSKSEVSSMNTGQFDDLTGCGPTTSTEQQERGTDDDDDYLF